MIQPNLIWTVARDELRLTRRTFRYWAFAGGAWLLGLAAYLYYSGLHGFFSAFSGSVALIGPHYLFGVVGFYYLAIFLFGVAFLGFDIRARDQREGIVEVLDARPLSNLELVIGRWLGLLLAAWIPILTLTLFIEGLGALLLALGSPMGDTLEPLSLLTFAVFMSIPAIAFSFALVFVITLLVRHRFVAAVVSLAALYGLFAMLMLATPTTAALIDFIGITQVGTSSDIMPTMARDIWGWVQRGGVLTVALALLGIAAAIHPRLDDGRRAMRFAASAGVLALGLALIGATGAVRQRQIDRVDHWSATHKAHADEVAPDIITIRGTVTIDPGDALDATLTIELRAPAGATLEHALFTLNPGLTVLDATAADGSAITLTHSDGLLDLTLPRPLAGAESMTVTLSYRGAPDTAFGYLDNAISVERGNVTNGTIALLGVERGIFDRRFVALMPGIGWLPLPGADIARDDTNKRRRDFFLVDLEVDLPAEWLPAGPGRRQNLTGAATGRARYRFGPQVPIPEVALVAAKFQSYSTEIEGVTFELLAYPPHQRNYRVLGDQIDRIRAWGADSLRRARDEGLAYPFDALTLVEVPFNLRSYRGGWRLDTAFGPPAMVLLRESGLPTARIDVLYARAAAPPGANVVNLDADASSTPEAPFVLRRFFSNDFTGGNALVAASQSFFAHQTGATGPEALALNFALEQLATLALTDTRSYFSAHLFDSGFNARATQLVQQYNDRRPRSLTLADVVLNSFISRPDVWESVLSASLVSLDPGKNPRQAIDILSLKAGAMAQLLYDQLGPAGTTKLLGNLVQAHRGESFTLADFTAALAAAGLADPGALLADWLNSTQLPGFVAEAGEFYRIADDALGNPQYQLKVRVRNDEPAPGTIRISWIESLRNDDVINANQMRRVPGDLIRLPGHAAIEFTTVLTRKPVSVWVEPSLSLNRGAFIAYADYERAEVYAEARRDDPPQRGIREIPWQPNETGIVVDDLDPGFSVTRADAATGLRLGRETTTGDLDQGLPRVPERGAPNQWSRAETASAWGKYRHTMVYLRPGDGATSAAFTATLPQPGRWRLELHLPNLVFNNGITTWGRWSLSIRNADTTQTVEFDNAGGTAGWNELGEYELPAGEVTVTLSDQSEGRLVVADAIRWSPRPDAAPSNNE